MLYDTQTVFRAVLIEIKNREREKIHNTKM